MNYHTSVTMSVPLYDIMECDLSEGSRICSGGSIVSEPWHRKVRVRGTTW
jgi:hypothetical protein